jgi:hypothetical protein
MNYRDFEDEPASIAAELYFKKNLATVPARDGQISLRNYFDRHNSRKLLVYPASWPMPFEQEELLTWLMLSEGAGGTYYFHYMPTAGGRGGFLALDKDYHVVNYPPQYLAAQVITKEWVQPVEGMHKMFRSWSDLQDDSGNALVTAYAVERPDGQWSVLLVNKDQTNDHSVRVSFNDGEKKQDRHFSGTVERISFGAAEYQWHADAKGRGGHADPDGPASKGMVPGGSDAMYQLPKASVTVLRGHIE